MALFGLMRRRECWVLTRRARLFLGVLVIAASATVVTGIHPFLAVHDPVGGEVLVVEGWVARYALERAVDRFRSGGYQWLVTTGGPLGEEAVLLECFPRYETHAQVSAALIRRMGVDEARLAVVSTPRVVRNRTYASAVAVGDWLADSGRTVSSLDVFTVGPHARRTRMLYRLALGDRVRVGVIGTPYRGYDPRRWWRSSAGAKRTVTETIAFIYAKLLFTPEGN